MNTQPLSPIPQNTLADTATARLREAIISGQLAPGERLAEPTLAAQLGISRSPVREALRRLEAEGLVQVHTNRGGYVWDPSEADVDEILSLRVMIECLAAEWAIPKLTEEDLARLEAIVEGQRRSLQAGEYFTLLEEDRHFHEYVCQRANHSRLLGWWQQIISQWQVLIHRRLRHRPQEVTTTVLGDHQAILEALRRRDLATVMELHRAINQRVSQEVKGALRA